MDEWSFDTAAAAGQASGGSETMLPPAEGHLWPTPDDLISDHEADGAPARPATRPVPTDPPQGPLWTADHDNQVPPATRGTGPQGVATPAGNHDGHQGKAPIPQLNIGAPFTVEVTRFVRHLAGLIWDPTGKIVNPPDAPSAPVQIYGSEHNTRPRLTQSAIGPIFNWAWPAGDQFSTNPGYLGVNASEPDMAARPFGAEAAQPATDPYVAVAAAATAPAADVAVDYDLGF